MENNMENIAGEIKQLAKEKDVAILAHYYVDGEVQALADYVGDSYYLSKIATGIEQKNILFCGVSFMGESAKILNPGKKVIMADELADCPMAHMVDLEKIEEVRNSYEDVAVVCYVNSTAEIKAKSDVCVTSSNALRVVKALPNRRIFFIPDNNLGRYIASQVPEKEFIFHDGFCHVHKSITAENVKTAKQAHPEALVLAHPECTGDVLELADFIGSTSEIIDYATKSDQNVFIICTEMGIFYELTQKNPQKKFYSVGHRQFCPNMKRITMEKVRDALLHMAPEVVMEEDLRQKAYLPLNRMLELAK
jgi:quinolinate synthase